ncbi:hydrolase, NUDIX family protein [Tritrichomonas foetus]|uniref:Hydrolase, NUDIX family protein n=1 Tax=Tritrichomonas foetus TaxID=1144522 RepID=A0A1J4J674_9EUKA|nr:hydrolase, NUDIX family protein [Tritrichomonas foetus]|eukprot:OHS94718.1 hydrolase, NUDIX family protein [Tritrichomonas foetus]
MTLNTFGFPLKIPDNIAADIVENSQLIHNWRNRLDPSVHIEDASIVTIDLFGKRIGYVEIEANYTLNNIKNTEKFILSGESCMVLVLLHSIDTNENFTVLVQQPRVGCGKIMYEFPAGSTDGSKDFLATAARELAEEVGIHCDVSDMIQVSQLFCPEHPKTYLNHPRFDQSMLFYLVIQKLTKNEIMEYEGKQRGAEEDEQISLHVIPFEESWKYANEPASLTNFLMVQELIASGKISLQ